MSVRILACVAVAIVTTSCATTEPTGGPGTSAPTVPSHQPSVIAGPAGTLTAVVQEPSTRSQHEVRLLRVEDLTGKTLIARTYRAEPVELSEPLAVGSYRVISWVQDCGGSCVGVPDDKLAAPARICGVKVDIAENGTTKVAVDASAETACAMTVGA